MNSEPNPDRHFPSEQESDAKQSKIALLVASYCVLYDAIGTVRPNYTFNVTSALLNQAFKLFEGFKQEQPVKL